VYHTQILQSEALGWAYRSWRRQWKGTGKRHVSFVVELYISPERLPYISNY